MTKDEIRLKVREILARANAEVDEHRAKGLCLGGMDGVFCSRPAKDVCCVVGYEWSKQTGGHADDHPGDCVAGPYDRDHCGEHAREIEIAMLAEDQEDDLRGRNR